MFAILLPTQGYLMADGYYSPEVKDAKRFSRRFDAEKVIGFLALKQAIIVTVGRA